MTLDELIEKLVALKNTSPTFQAKGDERVVLLLNGYLGDMETIFPGKGLVGLHSKDALPSVQHLAMQEAKLDRILELLERHSA